jgi:two-component system chemotaxis response regulator CheB/chemosensory pili system protein ChpB (putative protein-glutamate methylesterase)
MSFAEIRVPKVALARASADEARHLVEALREIGAEPAIEVDHEAVDGLALARAGVEVLVIALGEADDGEPPEVGTRLRVVFDDLSVSAGLAGWDRARWLRHLRAKILGVEETGPPRPAGASPIPVRARDALDRDGPAIAAEAPWRGQADGVAAPAHGVDSLGGPAADVADALGSGEDPAFVPAESIEDWPASEGIATEPVTAEPQSDFLGESAEPTDWTVDAFAPESVDDEGELREAAAGEAADDDWSSFRDGPPVPEADVPAGGLDDLLDALRREAPDEASERTPRASAAVSDAPAPRRPTFDLSNLALEPLEHERPISGRAQFTIDETPRSPVASPTTSATPASAVAASPAPAAWLIVAADADALRVESLVGRLPSSLPLALLLVRPSSAPDFGTELVLDPGDRMPMAPAEEIVDLKTGRIVVLAPGERAGFDRQGRMIVQPGDPTTAEAVGEWMTMRALAARFGPDAGVIVMGRLRDEVLEGAIEVARAGGQVWFESSVLATPDPVADAARAAGIAMRTGTAAELADALVARYHR